MAEELEIKLTLTDDGLDRALAWLLNQLQASRGSVKPLVNRYFDTPDAELNQQRAALRVRQAGERYIQTLKTQGDFVGGAHRRQEWEWPLPTADLDLQLLADTPLDDRIDLAKLQPVFETNFERQVVMLHEGDTVIEVAIDRGQVLSGTHARPLNEVELELKGGESAALITWAKKLAAQVPVFLNLVSKAEQGYFLAGQHSPDHEIPAEAGPVSVSEFLHGLSLSWLTGAPYPVKQLDFKRVMAAARDRGVSAQLEEVLDILEDGEPVETLLANPTLGQLQMTLVTA